jgi:hypothetical protein
MKLAIMQPYFMPYIGYFQLIKAVDKFIIYDDVNFIKQGWINRNRILNQNKTLLFTVPVKSISSFINIKNTEINKKVFNSWKIKFFKTLINNYQKSAQFKSIFRLIENILNSDFNTIAQLNLIAINAIVEYLNMKTEIIESSFIYKNNNLKSIYRIIDICKIENSKHYINPIGGIKLYDKKEFEKNNIRLNFLKSLEISYNQFNDKFIPNLSIIDVMMFNSPEKINKMLNEYLLI